MRTFIDEAEIKRVVKKMIQEGTPLQMKELTHLVNKRSAWKYKKKSLQKIIVKNRETTSC